MALTAEQQRLVKENHKLIYVYAWENKLNLDEFYDVLAIALCKAAESFDETKGFKFMTFAFRCMDNSVTHYMRSKNRTFECQEKILSYNYKRESYDGSEFTCYDDIVEDRKAVSQDDIVTNCVMESFIDTLDERRKFIVNRLLEGCTQAQIASMLGLSRQRVGALISKIRNQIRNTDYKVLLTS